MGDLLQCNVCGSVAYVNSFEFCDDYANNGSYLIVRRSLNQLLTIETNQYSALPLEDKQHNIKIALFDYIEQKKLIKST